MSRSSRNLARPGQIHAPIRSASEPRTAASGPGRISTAALD